MDKYNTSNPNELSLTLPAFVNQYKNIRKKLSWVMEPLIIESHDLKSYRNRIKYSKKDAKQYLKRRLQRHKSELALVRRAFRMIPVSHSVLDIPCGAGRMTVMLSKMGYQCTGAEISDVMIETSLKEIRKSGLDCKVHKIDIEAMTYTDRFFDTVLCFRLFHHFPSPVVRRRVVKEICRVARHYVALSYLSPLSYTSIKRIIKQKALGKIIRQYPTSLSEVESYFFENGFSLRKDFPEKLFVHSLHLAIFGRD